MEFSDLTNYINNNREGGRTPEGLTEAELRDHFPPSP